MKSLTLMALALSSFAVAAPVPNPKGGETKGVPEQRCVVLLLDGSRLHGVLADENMDVHTKYGKLTVPTREIYSVNLGLHYPEGAEGKIQTALKQLGSNEYKDREDASELLIKLGRISYVRVNEQLKKQNELEVKRRCERIKASIEANQRKEEIRTLNYDTIQSAEGSVKGRLTKSSLKLKTAHLDTLELKLSSIDKVLVTQQTALKMNVGVYGFTPVKWLNTGIGVDKGMSLSVLATGNVDMWTQQPGQYTCGPKGLNGTFYEGRASGALLGKIGDGQEFVVGESYDETATTAGFLYLRVAPTPWAGGTPPQGEYRVSISTKY